MNPFRVEPLDALTSDDLQRIRNEYVEMPGLAVTPRQAARLWGLTTGRSEGLLATLVDSGFLLCDKRKVYRRRQ
jgi:hypothetical protein